MGQGAWCRGPGPSPAADGLFLRRGTGQYRRHRHGPSPPMLAATAPCARLEQELVPGRLGSESALSLQQSSGMQGGGLVRTAEREAGRCVSFFSNLLRGTDRAVEHSAPSKKRQSSQRSQRGTGRGRWKQKSDRALWGRSISREQKTSFPSARSAGERQAPT